MGFVLNSVRGFNTSIEYLSDSALYVWGGSNNSLIANANSYTVISGAAPSAERGFGTQVAVGANRLIVRSLSGNTAVYSLNTNTLIHRPNNRLASVYDGYNKQLAIIGDSMIIADGAGRSNVYSLNNSFVTTLSINAAAVANSAFNAFGYSVAAADNRIAVSWPRVANSSGQIRVFNYNGEMLYDLSSSAPGGLPYSGAALDIGSGVIAVGAPLADSEGTNNNSGCVELYDYNGFFIKRLFPSTVRTNGQYGGALSIGSGVLAIAYWEQELFDIYTTSGELIKTVVLPSGAKINSIKVKYGKIFVGVPSLPISLNRGNVFIYDLQGNLIQRLEPNMLNNARLGVSIDVGYGYLAVGANSNNVSGTANSGSVILYRVFPEHTLEDALYTTYNGD